MPLPGVNLQDITSRKHVNRRGQGPGIVVEEFLEVSSQADHRFRGVPVPVHGHHHSRLDGAQHPLGKIFRAVPKDQVHPEVRRHFRPGGQFIEDVLGDKHGFVDTF